MKMAGDGTIVMSPAGKGMPELRTTEMDSKAVRWSYGRAPLALRRSPRQRAGEVGEVPFRKD